MRIHVVSLPHTLLTKDYDWCAYTAKVRRFISMLAARGNDALVYASDVRDPQVDADAFDYVNVVNAEDRLAWFGAEEWDRNRVFDRWDEKDVAWTTMNARAANAIRDRWQDGDVLGIIGGRCQLQIINELSDLNPLSCEWGIGYSGVLGSTHKVYESYAWMQHVAGYYREDDVRFYDDVIPNCFDPGDFTFSDTHGDYLLYLGRPNPRKGLPIIADIAKRTHLPVIIAGQPGDPIENTQHVGIVLGQRKQDLLAGARALLTPTTYLEPFGGVAVEAMMSGTPVISTDWGAFTETVIPGLSGYRCRMLVDFLQATEDVLKLDRAVIRDYAMERYSTDTGATLYDDYLNRLLTLHGEGWYAGADERGPHFVP